MRHKRRDSMPRHVITGEQASRRNEISCSGHPHISHLVALTLSPLHGHDTSPVGICMYSIKNFFFFYRFFVGFSTWAHGQSGLSPSLSLHI